MKTITLTLIITLLLSFSHAGVFEQTQEEKLNHLTRYLFKLELRLSCLNKAENQNELNNCRVSRKKGISFNFPVGMTLEAKKEELLQKTQKRFRLIKEHHACVQKAQNLEAIQKCEKERKSR